MTAKTGKSQGIQLDREGSGNFVNSQRIFCGAGFHVKIGSATSQSIALFCQCPARIHTFIEWPYAIVKKSENDKMKQYQAPCGCDPNCYIDVHPIQPILVKHDIEDIF